MAPVNKSVDWDQYVFSAAFDRDCAPPFKHRGPDTSPNEDLNLWDDSSPTWTDPSEHGVSKLEAYLYYNGVRGDRRLGPKLIYRTSTDTFPPPSWPSQELRKMQLLSVHGHEKLAKDDLWAVIRDKTVGLLDRKHIMHTSIDLVRFLWERTEEGDIFTSRVTIWIGVFPDSTNGDAAFGAAQEILELLKMHEIDDIDIAFRESVAHPLAGPVLCAPVDDLHPLRTVIDWVATPLSQPIAGVRTQDVQGSLGFYFKVGEDLYGVTARHVLFPVAEGNYLYRYTPSIPKKRGVLMGRRAFQNLLTTIQISIGNLRSTATVLRKNVSAAEEKARGGDSEAEGHRTQYQQRLDDTETSILELKKFWAVLKTDWSAVADRVIGHVVWSPPLTGLNPPHGYACDVCVIKLDKDKFLPNLRGNVVDLGTEIEAGRLMSLLQPRHDAPDGSEFDYPVDRLYALKTILPAAQMKEPDTLDLQGDPVRFVLKRGHATRTTIGRLNGFPSRTRRYGRGGHLDAVEAAACSYDSRSGPFACRGDSGAAIVGAHNEFVAQLTGCAGTPGSCDIAYGTPMDWLWNEVIQPEFPNAVLFFDAPAP